ncbi:DUF1206 domain-containing protein [Pontibacter akesuensis]|uniref:DUF1206 domain-containing protein n=1 Tax=Pontibacter akesuensis TaxID=388950 RepID=A0A1I7FKP0_9BACT|nr:DUF1206 domain-containing protein [Pontibacter akesuensis]GHA61711.1 membrane protein [Pontibacter akesuensis]SFU36753.1 protein of unknown function [Pontibacter akesuensis]
MTDIASIFPSVPHKWTKRLARVGLAAKGAVYFLLGVLALMVAFGLGNGRGVSRKHVFLFIEELAFGRLLVGLLAIGLASYCAWRLLQACADTEGKGTDWKGILYRLRYAASGTFYSLLAFGAGKLALGGGGSGIRQAVIGQLLQRPLGLLLVIGGGLVVALAGVFQIYQGLSEHYTTKVREQQLSPGVEETMIKTGKVGYVARGTVWGIVGYLLLRAAFTAQQRPTGGAFQFLESMPYGSYLLGTVAVGLICYSFFVFIQARFRYSSK